MSDPPCRSRKNIEILIELDPDLRTATAEIGPMIAVGRTRRTLTGDLFANA